MVNLPEQTGVIYKIAYSPTGDGKTLVHCYGRDTTGARLDRTLTGIVPRFWVPAKQADRFRNLPEVVSVKPGPPGIMGEETAEVAVHYPLDVPKIRTNATYRWEDDILFSIVARIGHRLTYARFPAGDSTCHVSKVVPLDVPPKVTPRIAYLDIEVAPANEGNFGELEEANDPITAVSIYDSMRNQYGCIYVGQPMKVEDVLKHTPGKPDNEPGYRPGELEGPLRLFPVANEYELLGSLGMALAQIDPDIVCAWNGLKYDFLYLANRTLKFLSREPSNEDLKFIVTTFDEHARRNHGRAQCIDPMEVLKKQETKQKSYSLNAVAWDVLGYGKIERLGTVAELQREDPVKWVAYNVTDSMLMKRINAKLSLTNYFCSIAFTNGVEPEDAYFNSRVVDGAMMTEARLETGEPYCVLPSKSRGVKDVRVGKGAVVFDTITAKHRAVMALDLAQQYPNCLMSLNIGPETRRPIAIPGLTFDLPNGSHYIKQPIGLMARAARRMQALRNEAKRIVAAFAPGTTERDRAETVSTGIKFANNSLVGCLDEPHYRLADVDCFESVTTTSQAQVRWNRDHLESGAWLTKVFDDGHLYTGRVVLGDTDSCYAQLYRDGALVEAYDEVVASGNKLKTALNESYTEFYAAMGCDKHFTEVDFEGVYRVLRCLPLARGEEAAKKRYFGLWEHYKGADVRGLDYMKRRKISGIEIKRFNVAPITKEVQSRVVELDLYDREAEILPYLATVKERSNRGELDYEHMLPAKFKDPESYKAVQQGKEPPPFVRAAMNLVRLLGYPLRPGQDVVWAYITGLSVKGVSHPEVKEFALPKGITLEQAREAGVEIRIDRERMYQKNVEDPVASIYPEINGRRVSLADQW